MFNLSLNKTQKVSWTEILTRLWQGYNSMYSETCTNITTTTSSRSSNFTSLSNPSLHANRTQNNKSRSKQSAFSSKFLTLEGIPRYNRYVGKKNLVDSTTIHSLPNMTSHVLYCTSVQTIRLLFGWENKQFVGRQKVKMFYKLILFWQAAHHIPGNLKRDI